MQFLTHRREMQAELLRLTDALQAAGRQIVLTSDRPPAEIEALDERLIRRFAGGLVIDIAAPDYETRVAILRRKAEERRRQRSAPACSRPWRGARLDNVRELIGALNRLIAFQAVSDTPLDAAAGARQCSAGGAAAAAPAAGRPPIARRRLPPTAAAGRRRRRRVRRFLSEITATRRAAGGGVAGAGSARRSCAGRARATGPAG